MLLGLILNELLSIRRTPALRPRTSRRFAEKADVGE